MNCCRFCDSTRTRLNVLGRIDLVIVTRTSTVLFCLLILKVRSVCMDIRSGPFSIVTSGDSDNCLSLLQVIETNFQNSKRTIIVIWFLTSTFGYRPFFLVGGRVGLSIIL